MSLRIAVIAVILQGVAVTPAAAQPQKALPNAAAPKPASAEPGTHAHAAVLALPKRTGSSPSGGSAQKSRRANARGQKADAAAPGQALPLTPPAATGR